MRILALVTTFVAVAIVLVATTACSYLSVLEVADFDITPLIQGDLRPLFTSPRFWSEFPCLWRWNTLVAVGPAFAVAIAFVGVLAIGRRLRLRHEVRAAMALLTGVFPYAIGAFALRYNTVAADTGPWLVWMLIGPLYAAVLALTCLAVAGLPRRDAVGSAVPGRA